MKTLLDMIRDVLDLAIGRGKRAYAYRPVVAPPRQKRK